MRSTKGLVLLLGALLTGCASMDTRVDPTGVLFAQDLQHMTDSYNSEHGTHYPVPHLSLDPIGLPDSVVGASDYSTWTIHLNPIWVQQDHCLVQHEALPHELAHLIFYYQKYGPPQIAALPMRNGIKLVAMNGPGLQDVSDEHGREWQQVARDLGADPCKEGYCYSDRPYKKYPLKCAGSQTLVASIR
jgi:predicted SprT family Zn-dependent metalloprotease